MSDINKLIHDKFDSVLDWRYNNNKRDSINITFKDGSQAVYAIKDIEKMPSKESFDPRGYRYVLRHGLGPGTLPEDVKILHYENYGDYYMVWLDRFLTTKELNFYDVPSETKLSYYDNILGYKEERLKRRQKNITVMEALTEDEIKEISELSLTETEIGHILSLFELISDENKDRAFDVIISLFKDKKLVPDDKKESNERSKSSVSERYTRILLGE